MGDIIPNALTQDSVQAHSDADFDVLRGVPEFDEWMDAFRRAVKEKK